jgi:predicted transcriptional regulator
MSKIKTRKPTDAELEILNVLWHRGALTVKEVHEVMGGDTGYTTTLKLLQNMTEKSLVSRNESKRAHVYVAKCSEFETRRQLLAGLLKKAFRGSTAQLVIQALSSERATREELAEIKKLVERLAREGK